MVLSSGLATFLTVLTALGITGLLLFLYLRFTKRTHPLLDKLVVIFAFIAGMIFWGFCGSHSVSISVISSNSIKHYTAVWPCTFKASDDHEYDIVYDDYGQCIINATDEDLVADFVMYGMGIDFGYVTAIPAHSLYNTSCQPDYLPWQTAPDQVTSSIKMDSKLWIRRPEPDDEYTTPSQE